MAPLLVILLAFLQISLQSEYVPVVLWGDKSINLKESLVGRTISESEFHNLYLENLKYDYERSIVLFSTSSLSIEDFSKYSDAYNEKSNGAALKSLKNRIENGVSRQLISVENPYDAVMALGQKNLNLYKKYEIDSMTNFPNIAEERILLIVSLPEDAAKSDKLINSVLNKFDLANKKYLAVFTGEKSSSIEDPVRIGRHLLEKNDDDAPKTDLPSTPTLLDCGIIFAKQANISINTHNPKDAIKTYGATAKLTDAKADCKSSIFTIPFESDDKKILLSVQFKSEFFSKNYKNPPFRIYNYSIDLSIEGQKVNFDSDRMDQIGPRKSFHCGNLILSNRHEPDSRKFDVFIALHSFQFQMSTEKPEEAVFFNAEDCVGFFTGPIWSGIVAVLVLGLILVFGILMIMDIKTMDRFDDPKGKHLNLGKID